jgi:hypothetical protein
MKIPIFITEFIKHFITTNPVWAKRIQAVSLIVGAIAWLPELLQFLEIPQSAWMEVLHNKFVKIGSLLALIVAQYPNAESSKEKIESNGLGSRPDDRNPPPKNP